MNFDGDDFVFATTTPPLIPQSIKKQKFEDVEVSWQSIKRNKDARQRLRHTCKHTAPNKQTNTQDRTVITMRKKVPLN